MPSLETDVERLPSIVGSVPPAYALPEGCRFADRCEFAMSTCRQVQPQVQYIKEEHKVRCHLFAEKEGVCL